MNEAAEHAMLGARCKALETIALQYMDLFALATDTHFPTEAEHKANLERAVERLVQGHSLNKNL